MIGEARCLGRGLALKRFVLSAVIVKHERQGVRVVVVFQLFAVGVREAGKSPRAHANRRVVPLDHSRANPIGFREAHHALFRTTCASRWGVSHPVVCGRNRFLVLD